MGRDSLARIVVLLTPGILLELRPAVHAPPLSSYWINAGPESKLKLAIKLEDGRPAGLKSSEDISVVVSSEFQNRNSSTDPAAPAFLTMVIVGEETVIGEEGTAKEPTKYPS